MATKKLGNLLIVDDSETILRILEGTANSLGTLTPYLARSYVETSELLQRVSFEVAILDLDLPDAHMGETIDLCHGYSIPSIVLTGTIDETLRSKVLSKPIADYIVKSNLEGVQNAVYMAENIAMFKDKKVLVVDDSPLSRTILRSHFSTLNFKVYAAKDGQEALAILSENLDMDLITVDYEMPGMNGIELIGQIKSLMKSHVPVIIGVCGSSDEHTSVRFLKSGANEVFAKPVVKEIFNLKIANIMKLLRQQKELLTSQKITEEYQKALYEGGLITKADIHGKVTFINKEYCEFTGYSEEEVLGKPHSIFRHQQTPKSTFKEMWEAISAKNTWKGVLRNVRKNGTSFYAKTAIIPILSIDDTIVEFVALRDDVTQLVESDEQLKNNFYNDYMTGLGNRRKMLNDVKDLPNPAVVVFDIVDFKNLNNSLGTKIGDFIIIEISNRLFDCFDGTKYDIYRIGGDQFAIVKNMPSDADKVELENKIECCIDKMQTTPLNFDKQDFHVSLKVGLAYGCNDISQADMALKHAKSTGKNIVIFSDNLRLSDVYKMNYVWSRKIKQALDNDRFVPYFQPIICNQTYQVVEHECLVRMIDNDGRVVLPAEFLDIAKKSGLYLQITNVMLQKCFGVFAKNDHHFSLNITLEDILDNNISELIIKTLAGSKIGRRVTFGIIESEGADGAEHVAEFVKKIKTLDAKIAIDDFGTGYSNFDYLIKLKADFIKIDGSLIQKLADSAPSYSIVKAVVEFARNNGYKTVAECVATKDIFDKVIELGIDYSQGNYISQPQPVLNLIPKIDLSALAEA